MESRWVRGCCQSHGPTASTTSPLAHLSEAWRWGSELGPVLTAVTLRAAFDQVDAAAVRREDEVEAQVAAWRGVVEEEHPLDSDCGGCCASGRRQHGHEGATSFLMPGGAEPL